MTASCLAMGLLLFRGQFKKALLWVRLISIQGVFSVGSEIELREVSKNKQPLDTFLIQELLPGDEYTVDCFSTKDGKLLFCNGRKRERIRMGTSMCSYPASDDINTLFKTYAQIIQDKINISGPWFFQMKSDAGGKLKLLEIDTRIAGTMALNRVTGINFPLLALYDRFGYDLDLLLNTHRIKIDRCLHNRYAHDISYDTVYVDLDDTLLIRGKINCQLVYFLYQSINQKKKIVLITKSLAKDIQAELRKYRISELFDETIWIDEDKSKADYIKAKNAIFIDDSFSQRSEVSKRHHIPTFDNSMIEMLLCDHA